MDLTTRLHNNATHDLTVELVDQFNLSRVPRRRIRAGGSIDLGRRIGFSDTNPELRLRLRVVAAETATSINIMPIDIFLNADINISSSTDPDTRQRTIRVNYPPAARSINRLRIVRWARDLNAYAVAVTCAWSSLPLMPEPDQPEPEPEPKSGTGVNLEKLETIGSQLAFVR